MIAKVQVSLGKLTLSSRILAGQDRGNLAGEVFGRESNTHFQQQALPYLTYMADMKAISKTAQILKDPDLSEASSNATQFAQKTRLARVVLAADPGRLIRSSWRAVADEPGERVCWKRKAHCTAQQYEERISCWTARGDCPRSAESSPYVFYYAFLSSDARFHRMNLPV